MILFLDFDGVLHPEAALSTRVDFQHLPLLWRILREVPEVEVVFATSWRNSHSLDELVFIVTRGGGEDLAHRFIGMNPIVDKASREQGGLGHERGHPTSPYSFAAQQLDQRLGEQIFRRPVAQSRRAHASQVLGAFPIRTGKSAELCLHLARAKLIVG